MGEKKEKEDLVILLASQSKGGKSTFATALCDSSCRKAMYELTDKPTSINVNWHYIKSDNPEQERLHLTHIDLNMDQLYDAFNEKNKSVDKQCDFEIFCRIFDLTAYIEDSLISVEDIRARLESYIERSGQDLKLIKNLVQLEVGRKYVNSIDIAVPLERSMLTHSEINDVLQRTNLVLRDTCGWLSQYDCGKFTSESEVDISGVDAVILFGFTTEYVSTKCWNIEEYKTIFSNVPVFNMIRSEDFLAFLNKLSCCKDLSIGITTETIEKFLDKIYSMSTEDWESDSILQSHFYQSRELRSELDFDETMSELCASKQGVYYVLPKFEQISVGECKFDIPAYKLYEQAVYYSAYKIIKIAYSYKETCYNILQTPMVLKQLFQCLYNFINVHDLCMSPWGGGNDLDETVEKFLKDKKKSLLGIYGGITTKKDNTPCYSGTLFCATTTYKWLWNAIDNFAKNVDIAEVKTGLSWNNVSDDQCRALIRTCLWNKLIYCRDKNARYENNCLVNRFIVVYAIDKLYRGFNHTTENNQGRERRALTDCCFNVATCIFNYNRMMVDEITSKTEV